MSEDFPLDRWDDFDEPKEDVTCRKCGKDGLFWSGRLLCERRPNGSIDVHRCNYTHHFEVIE